MLKPVGRIRLALVFLAGSVLAQAPFPQKSTFEGQPSFVLANDKLSLSIWERGGAIVDLVLKDDPEKLSPLWNPVRLARELGQTREAVGSAGHFVCVDGFGPPSTEERAAGIPMHGVPRAVWQTHRLGEFGVTSQQEGAFEKYFSAMMSAPIVGSLAGNVLKNFGVELDYPNQKLYLSTH